MSTLGITDLNVIEQMTLTEYEYGVNGRFQRGFATLPEAVTKKLKATGYRFHDTTKADALTGEDLTAIPQPKVDSSTVTPGEV
ncbi:phage major tail protein%2C TP901-1 family%3B phi 11 orf39 [Staphylococcus aureus]|nr:phage major tail protein%2C TP901-1 family%3B phi 11 orf39 [Staphylococcus aureus]